MNGSVLGGTAGVFQWLISQVPRSFTLLILGYACGLDPRPETELLVEEVVGQLTAGCWENGPFAS